MPQYVIKLTNLDIDRDINEMNKKGYYISATHHDQCLDRSRIIDGVEHCPLVYTDDPYDSLMPEMDGAAERIRRREKLAKQREQERKGG